MKKILTVSMAICAIVLYSLIHTENKYKDMMMSYRHWFQLTQEIGAKDMIDYDVLASGLEYITAKNPSRYKPYEFAALFASTLNKLNYTISSGNVDRLIAIASYGLQQNCDSAVLQTIQNTSVEEFSTLDLPEYICEHKQLPSLLGLIYATYKNDDKYAQKLYFLASRSRQ